MSRNSNNQENSRQSNSANQVSSQSTVSEVSTVIDENENNSQSSLEESQKLVRQNHVYVPPRSISPNTITRAPTTFVTRSQNPSTNNQSNNR